MNSLGLAARERAGLPFEREVAESDFVQIADALGELAYQYPSARRDRGVFQQGFKPCRQVAYRYLTNVGDRLLVNAYIECFRLELSAVADGAGNEAPILREQNSDVGLVPFALEPAKESSHSRP